MRSGGGSGSLSRTTSVLKSMTLSEETKCTGLTRTRDARRSTSRVPSTFGASSFSYGVTKLTVEPLW